MIDERTEERAALYALDLLSGQEKRDFETSLEKDPELRKRVREFSASLHAPIRDLDGPARPDLLEGILARVEESPAAPVSRPVSPLKPSTFTLPWAHIWAAAALLFLFLNIGLLVILNRNPLASGIPDSGNIAASANGSRQTSAVYPVNRTLLEARIARLEESLAERDETLRRINDERFELKAENEEVKSFNAGWQREYSRLASRFLPFFEGDNGLSRFTVIEMVDASAYRDGLPRLGFNELAARYLTGESNIAGIGSDEFVGPFVEGAGIASAVGETGQVGLTPIAQGGAASYPDLRMPDALAESAGQTATEAEAGQRPAGFTVWRDDEQKGFLDLYNLPAPRDGEEAFLWVRSGELDPYLAVGAIPDLSNGTGSLFYSVDEPNFTPSEILITSEPPDTSASEPSGTILLRGP
jgi:FtsZ-binding cell division protein ZapB